MKTYNVQWNIDVDANSPLEAAQQAFAAMQRTGTSANVFDVWDDDGTPTRIDLEEAGL